MALMGLKKCHSLKAIIYLLLSCFGIIFIPLFTKAAGIIKLSGPLGYRPHLIFHELGYETQAVLWLKLYKTFSCTNLTCAHIIVNISHMTSGPTEM